MNPVRNSPPPRSFQGVKSDLAGVISNGMKKALVLVLLVALALGGSLFVERADAAQHPAQPCDPCDATECDPELVCRGDPSPGDGQAEGLCQAADAVRICNPLQTDKLIDIVNNVLTILFNFAIVLAPVMVVVAGIMFVTAGASPERVSTAKRILLWTAVGFIIILLARGLIVVIRAIIGF